MTGTAAAAAHRVHNRSIEEAIHLKGGPWEEWQKFTVKRIRFQTDSLRVSLLARQEDRDYKECVENRKSLRTGRFLG